MAKIKENTSKWLKMNRGYGYLLSEHYQKEDRFHQRRRYYLKKTIVTVFNLSFIGIGIWLFYLRTIYMGVNSTFNSGPTFIIIGIVLTIVGFKKDKNTQRRIFVIFPIGIAIILALIISEIPNVTYKEAQKIIEEETSESILTPPKNEKVGQLGMYIIYTEQGKYIVNAEDGTFAKSEWIRKK